MTSPTSGKYTHIKRRILDSLAFESAILTLFENHQIEKKGHADYIGFSKSLTDLLNKSLLKSEAKSFMAETEELAELMQDCATYRERFTEEQNPDRYFGLKGDGIVMRVRKLFKRSALYTNWAANSVANWFRKEKKARHYGEHEIPERAVAEYVYKVRFLERFYKWFYQFLQNREIRIREFYLLDRELEQYQMLDGEQPDFATLLKELRSDLENDQQEIENYFEEEERELDKLFQQYCCQVGTIEFPEKKLKPYRLQKLEKKAVGRLDQLLNNAQFNFYALAEHWRLKQQNRQLIFQLNQIATDQNTSLLKEVNEVLKPEFISLKKELSGFVANEPAYWKAEGHVDEVRTFIEQRIPDLMQLVFQTKLVSLVERPVLQLEQQVNKGQEVHHFAAGVFDGKPVSSKNFRKVATRNLLLGSVVTPLKKEFQAEYKRIVSIVHKLTQSLEEIKFSAAYSVDFYLSQRREGADGAEEEFNEGLKRIVKKTDEILATLASLTDLTKTTFDKLSEDFKHRVLDYFEPHRLNESEKRNERKEFKEHQKERLQNYWQTAGSLSLKYFRKSKEIYSVIHNKYFNLRSLLGISYEMEPISAELSNYLSETKHAIRRLPLMYQKLFENSPLTEERFYLPRMAEIKKLNDALESWKAGRFSPVCIIGEQGSGTTTILNFFTKAVEKEIAVERLELKSSTYLESEFLAFLQPAFPEIACNSVDELIARVRKMDGTKVVILENIHKLFLRNSGDYGNLMLLFKLVSQTNSRVFWITSCYLYSWKMLDYTNSISGYFAHVVEFKTMENDRLRDAILKRHQVSGFSLTFLEPDKFVPKRSYHKMDEDEKQEYLKKMFFDALGQHTQSNLSLAFTYWLRSIKRVEDGEIEIQQKRLNFSFLNSLKMQELTTLHSILIHGGMGLEEHSRVFRCTEEESFRMMMVLTDDGLLVKSKNVYTVNPLVYRMLVSHLKSLNFIY